MINAALAVLETNEQRNELAKFYKKYKQRLYKIAYSKLKNIHDAEDAVMDAILRIADKPDKFFQLKDKKRCGYVSIIVRNAAIDLYNKTHITEAVELCDDLFEDRHDISLEEQIISNLSKNELVDFIMKLPPLQRDILQLKAYQDFSNSEIAQQLGVTENVVRQRLFQAKKAIKDFLEKGNFENV